MTKTLCRVDVRLHTDERALVAELQAALTTPLRPRVNASDVLRAGLRSLKEALAILAITAQPTNQKGQR